jgi:hypothetical protein
VDAINLLRDIVKGAVPSLPLTPKDPASDDLRVHILHRLQRLCSVPEPELARVAKSALIEALNHREGPAEGSDRPRAGCWPRKGGRSTASETLAGKRAPLVAHTPCIHGVLARVSGRFLAQRVRAPVKPARCRWVWDLLRIFHPCWVTVGAVCCPERLADRIHITGVYVVETTPPLASFYDKYTMGTGALYGRTVVDDSATLVDDAMAKVRVPGMDGRVMLPVLSRETAPVPTWCRCISLGRRHTPLSVPWRCF